MPGSRWQGDHTKAGWLWLWYGGYGVVAVVQQGGHGVALAQQGGHGVALARQLRGPGRSAGEAGAVGAVPVPL